LGEGQRADPGDDGEFEVKKQKRWRMILEGGRGYMVYRDQIKKPRYKIGDKLYGFLKVVKIKRLK